MTERKGKATPVVAAGAIAAVAAADVVRRRLQGRREPQLAPAGVSDPRARNEMVEDSGVPETPRHRASEPEPEPEPSTIVDVPAEPEPEPPAAEPVAEVAPVAVASPEPEPEPDTADLPVTAPAASVPPLAAADHDSEGDSVDPPEAPNWWHRDHPTFSALTGFFTGIAFLVVVPGVYAGLLAQFVEYDRAEELFPFVLLTLIIPIVLMAIPKSRRFGLYMLIGLLSTLIVVGGVAALVIYVLFATS